MTSGTHDYLDDPRNGTILISINGEMHLRDDAKVSVFDSGFMLGDGVWEGIRLHNGCLLFLDEHMERLYEGAKFIDMDIGLSAAEMVARLHAALDANGMTTDVHIRLMVTRGIKSTPYQHPKVTITPPTVVIIPEYKKTDPNTYIKGVNIGRVPNIRPNESILSPHYNTLSKLNCILASIEANKLGYDEGIMNDISGNISTCNSTNLFFIKNNRVLTSTGEYCLNGITRGKAILVCNQNNIKCYETNFTFEDIKNCNEAFVTGTFAGIIPVSQLEDRKLESTNSDSLVNKIRILYNQEIQDYIG